MATEQENGKSASAPADSPEKKMGRHKLVTASNASAYVLLTVGAVVLINLIGTRVFGRVDLTENHVYTLAPGSKEIVSKLPDYLTVKAYISKNDLPPEMKSVANYVRDLLDEYKNYSKGKLRFESLDPTDDKKIEEEAGQCKVQKLQVQVMRSQKFEVGTHYLGICFQYQGKDEAIPQATQVEGLEYRISSLIKRLTQKKQKIAVTNGHGEAELGYLKHIEEFEVTNLNPSSGPIPDDVDALIVAGPKQPFDDKGRHEIDAFLMKGKGAIFMVDGMAMQQPRGNMPPEMMAASPKIGQANDSGLNELLEKYGFKIGSDFVLDSRSVPGPIDLPDGRKMLANLPVYVGVKTAEDQKDLSLMDHIGALVFPFASSVELVGPLANGKPAAGKLWTVAKTAPSAWKATGMFFFSPTTKIEEGKDKGSFGLAYAYEGPLKSAFAPAAPQAGMSTPDQPNAPPSEAKKPVRLLVIGDSDFASEEYLQLGRYLPIYQEGPQMLLNAMGWATEDEALTPVRTKTLTARPIQIEPGSAFALQLVNIAGVPLAFVAFGVARWRLRRARRQGLKL